MTTNEQVQAAARQTDTSDEACAVACMIVSNPQGAMQSEGWKRRVNDLIRALRDERNELRKQRNDLVDQNSYADLRASGGIYSAATPADPTLEAAHDLKARAEAAEKLVAEAAEVIRPFAQQAECWVHDPADQKITTCDDEGTCAGLDFTIADLRAARTWTDKHDKSQPD